MIKSVAGATYAPLASAFTKTQAELQPLLGFFVGLTEGVGVLLLAWSVYQLVIAFKDEAVEPKVRAVTMLVVATILLTSKTWLNTILAGTGVTV